MSTAEELRDMYRQQVLEHSRNPHNCCKPDEVTHRAEGHNQLCGDKLTVYMQMDDQQLTRVSFEGTGCAISMASASMMTEALNGQTLSAANKLIDEVHALLNDGAELRSPELSDIEALAGVRSYPSRIKCATLAWSAAAAALQGDGEQVTTE